MPFFEVYANIEVSTQTRETQNPDRMHALDVIAKRHVDMDEPQTLNPEP